MIATAYPLLFRVLPPALPGDGFAPKGIAMAVLVIAALAGAAAFGLVPVAALPAATLFALATGVLFGLSYTGNSAVSSYTRVRRETARYFVPVVSLYLASLTAFVVREVCW